MGTYYYVVANTGVPREAFELGTGSWYKWDNIVEMPEDKLAAHLEELWDGYNAPSDFWMQVAANLHAFCAKHEWKVSVLREPAYDETGPIEVVGSRYTEEHQACLAGKIVCPWLLYGYEVKCEDDSEPSCRACGTAYVGQARLKEKACQCEKPS